MRLMRVIRPLPALTDQPVVCQMRFTHSRGFTLLEVMVALAILAVALAGIMTTISTNVANAAGLKERTFANWVAMNMLTDMNITNEWPSTTTSEDSVVLANHEWYVKRIVKKPDLFKDLPVPKELQDSVREVEIQVRVNENDEYPLVTLTSYLSKSSS